MLTKVIDGVSFVLKEDFDFSFLSRYGKVFKVFDKQDSGNLCFGVRSGDKKRFIKLAGAVTVEGATSPSEAQERLRTTVHVYDALRHEHLIGVNEHGSVDGGYIAVFDWFDGECMGKQYDARTRFLALPVEEKLLIYDAVLSFHRHVNESGYVAVDFYDGCIMYNFAGRKPMICDIEMYRPMPATNDMGRMWGSGRYMSPEEFELGAQIDGRTNVFLMGAAAFELMGGGLDRSPAKWQAGARRYAAALKAVSPDRSARHSSIAEYMKEWYS